MLSRTIFRCSVLPGLFLVSACGSPETVVTGGDLGIPDLGSVFGTEPDAPLEPTSAVGGVTALDQRFVDLVPEGLDVFRLTPPSPPPAALVWRRGERRLLFANSTTGAVHGWTEQGGVTVVRGDLFSPGAPAAPAPVVIDPFLSGEEAAAPAPEAPAAEPSAPFFATAAFDGSLLVLDGRVSRVLMVPATGPDFPLEVWSAPPAARWGGFGGFAARPGVSFDVWFSAAQGPDGPGLYRFEDIPAVGAWPEPSLAVPLEAPGRVAFSPDGGFLVAASSGPDGPGWRQWPAGAVTAETGSVLAMADLGEGLDAGAGLVLPGGLLVDLAGNVYGAAPTGVEVFSPEGDKLGTIHIPQTVTDLAWGQDGTWIYAASPDGVYAFGVYAAAAGVPPGLPRVVVHTDVGPFSVELDWKAAPITVTNFLRYSHERFYEGSIFHRVIEGFVIQAGGLDPYLQPYPLSRPPIVNESSNGLDHRRGTVAMARIASPDSATSQFFVNVVDNRGRGLDPMPDDPARAGYAVFGRVTDGMQVVDAISTVEVTQVREHRYVPVDPVIIQRVEVLP